MNHFSLTQLALAALVITAAGTDLRRRRIPNWLTLSGVAAGLVLHTISGGLTGLKTAGAGMLLAFGVYFALYCLHAMGAGDVKLMAAVGALAGSSHWVEVFIFSALAGGICAVMLVIVKRRVRETVWNVGYILFELAHFRAPFWRRSHLDVKNPTAMTMPHGVAIAAGTLVCLLLQRV